MSIIITGSLAFDNILHFPGKFEDHILPDQLHNLNISFLVEDMKKMRGGCASNIAYSLALLGQRPSIMATAGKDFGEFREWLEGRGIDTSLIRIIEDQYTANCFITTDQNNNQITGFYSGAMSMAGLLSFRDIDYKSVEMAIISPNEPKAMVKYCLECRELGVPFIFDPGHNIPRITPEETLDCITGSVYTVVNDYELNMIAHKTGKSEDELTALTGAIIKTMGGDGCMVLKKDGRMHVKGAKARRICDPTGSGDAFRSGLITAHLKGLDMERIVRVANVTAVHVVEQDAPASHEFTSEEFAERYRETYGEELPDIF